MINYTIRIIKSRSDDVNKQYYDLGEFEDRWDKEEQALIAEFCLQNLCFFKHDVAVKDNYTLVVLVNAFYEILIIGDITMDKGMYFYSG